MTEPFLGEVRLFGFTFAPLGWATCDGQIMSIAQNTALFSLLGTTYGGNGQTTFALPDLRGRVPVHMGQGPGLSSYVEGQVGGTENVTLLANQLPPHGHTVAGASAATTKNPTNAVPAFTGSGASYGTSPDLQMSPAMISGGGSSLPHENLQPYLVLNWCIALQGIYPSRN
jgi:microcystin-dependent protein